MIVKLLTENHLELISLKGGCTGSSESTHVKMPHCWKSHALAHLIAFNVFQCHQPHPPHKLNTRQQVQLVRSVTSYHASRVWMSLPVLRLDVALVTTAMAYSVSARTNVLVWWTARLLG